MENPAERRLQSIARHLMISRQIISTHDLNPNSCSNASTDLVSSPPPQPVVIGGMVLDIHAKPYKGQDTIPRTTVPGLVTYINGGVARNIAECMSKLGCRPFMVSVVGTDIAGEILLKFWESAGLSTEGILKVHCGTTPVVANTFDSRGELAAGVASIEAVEKFVSPDFIRQFRDAIQSAPVVIIDANLHPQSLEVASRIAAEAGVPVWFEPVSVVKSTRIKSIAKYITVTSPNEDELIAMANSLSPGEEFHVMRQKLPKMKEQSVDSIFTMLKPAIHLLLEKGIKLLVVTLGPTGALICFRDGVNFVKHPMKNDGISRFRQHYGLVDKNRHPEWYTGFLNSTAECSHSYAFHLPALPASVVSLTGAGDCLVGGILASICNGLDVMQSVAMGIAVAKVAVESEKNVPAEFPLRSIAGEALQIFSRARQLEPKTFAATSVLD